MQQTNHFTNLQLELLKVFSFNIDEKQLSDIRLMLAEYFSKNISSEIDMLWDKNNWDNDLMKIWSEEHLRKSKD